MEKTDTAIAVFADHNSAEAAVKKLTLAGFEMKSLSVVGKGYQTDEKVIGFYNTGDRVTFCYEKKFQKHYDHARSSRQP
jgi:hypothetical protein